MPGETLTSVNPLTLEEIITWILPSSQVRNLVNYGRWISTRAKESVLLYDLLFGGLTRHDQHYARPLVYTPPSTNKQIIFLASTENIIRTLDAETGNVLKERRVAEPFPMAEAFCSIQVSQYVGDSIYSSSHPHSSQDSWDSWNTDHRLRNRYRLFLCKIIHSVSFLDFHS